MGYLEDEENDKDLHRMMLEKNDVDQDMHTLADALVKWSEANSKSIADTLNRHLTTKKSDEPTDQDPSILNQNSSKIRQKRIQSFTKCLTHDNLLATGYDHTLQFWQGACF